MKKKNKRWQNLIALISLSLLTAGASAQDFPILLHSNGAETFVESMDLGPDGDIYVTGRIGVWSELTLGACTGTDFVSPVNCPFPITSGQQDIFVARFHPDDSDPALNDLVWMVRGRSSIDVSPEVHSGKDIEIDVHGNAFFAGTLTGDVDFMRVFPVSCDYPTQMFCCPSTNMTRSFVGKINADGTPSWIADTRVGASSGSTYGEAVTLDLGNNRLFTGGYVNAPASGVSVYMRNDDCSDGCDFYATPEPSGYVGFIAEYDLNGSNYRGGILGERVMALKVANDDEHVWATGSTYGTDMDVMLADVHMDVIYEPCINFSINYFNIFGTGDDIGHDIDQTADGTVVFTGVYTRSLGWLSPPSPPGGMTIGGTNTDIFVGRLDGLGLDFTTTSFIPTGEPSTISPMPWHMRSSCIDADHSANRTVIGYNANEFGVLETQEIWTSFAPITDVSSIIPTVPDGDHARAMEINYGNDGWDGKRYMTGDMYHQSPAIYGFLFEGACIIGVTGTHFEGFITQLDGGHDQTMIMLGTDDVEESMAIELFPNPTDDRVTLRIENDNISMKIVDNKGRVLIEKDGLHAGEHSFDVSDFTPGVYLLEINSTEGNFTRKLIVN